MDSRSRHIAFLGRSSSLWAIQPEALLALVNGSWKASDWEALAPSTHGHGSSRMAVIPIQGVLSKDGPAYYGSSYDTITKAMEDAGSDPAVKRIVLSVDSPGGDVQGLPETAAVIAQVAKVKPVSAIVEGTSASAAYWLTSQASDVALTPSGEVGSVGVRMMHVDISALLANEGYKITELHAGDFKTEWSPFKPLSDEAVANMQPRLNATHQDFLNAVTNGRGSRVSAEMAGNRMGEGRMFSATQALRHGLVDKLQSPHEFYKAIAPAAEQPTFGLQRKQRAQLARLAFERSRFN